MDDRETEELMEDVASVMRSLVSSTVSPLMAEIERLKGLVSDLSGAMPDTAAIVRDARSGLVEAERIVDLEKQLADMKPLPDVPAIVREEVAVAVKSLPAPQDGRSVTVEEVRPLVDEAVSAAVSGAVKAIAVPKDGADGREGAVGLQGRGIAKLLTDSKGHILVTYSDGSVDDVGPIVGAKGEPGARGLDGKDGKDGAPGERGEKGEAGEPGRDGKDGAEGKDGLPGEKGLDGVNGRDGRDGADGEKGLDGAPGRDGIDGAAGAPGRDGEKGLDGIDGKDGVGLADALIDDEGRLVLTMTNGTVKALRNVVGKDGAPGAPGSAGANGRDGIDGLGFDDLTVEHDGERAVTIKFQRGDLVKEFPLLLPIVIDRGVWQERGHEGKGYQKGDGVTWSGQFYIARKETFAKPDDFEAWRLSVKKGRDAKDPVSLKGGS